MVCFDTDFLVAVLRGDDDAVVKLKEYERIPVAICTTPISACELFKGAYSSSYPGQNVMLVEEMLKNLRLLDFKLTSCGKAGEISNRLRRTGKPASDMDIMIAAITLSHDETLITRNIKHFEGIPELRMETW